LPKSLASFDGSGNLPFLCQFIDGAIGVLIGIGIGTLMDRLVEQLVSLSTTVGRVSQKQIPAALVRLPGDPAIRSSILNPQSSILNPQSSILNPQ
jgi:hypothetical protein